MSRIHEKDVILICKGWYNKEKYESVMDALKAYQCEKCGTSLEYLKPKPVTNLLILLIFHV